MSHARSTVAACIIDRTLLRDCVEFRDDGKDAPQQSVELHELHVVATLGMGGFGRTPHETRSNPTQRSSSSRLLSYRPPASAHCVCAAFVSQA